MPLPECIRIAFDDQVRRDELLALGWREIEILETWTGNAPDAPYSKIRAELAIKADRENLQNLAVDSFKFDRLHADPHVRKIDADAAKAKWVDDALNDPSRVVTVIRRADGIAGFLIHRADRQRKVRAMVIDLLAVDERHRRKGIALQLVAQAAKAGGFRKIKAGTQSTNEPARAFYKGMRMKVSRRQRTFHKP